MRKYIIGFCTVFVLMSGVVLAQSLVPQGLNFLAPTINGRSSVANPAVGEIVYDTSASSGFYGYNGTGWTDMNAGTAGAVIAFAGSTCPSGYLLANGSSQPIATYSSLNTAIGANHGDGSTNPSGVSAGSGCPSASGCFNLPDYRGRFLRGVDGGAGNDPDTTSRPAMATGGNTNNNVGSVQADDFKAHTHNSVTGSTLAGLNGSATYTNNNVPTATSTAPTTGGNETRPKNAYVNFCIKY